MAETNKWTMDPREALRARDGFDLASLDPRSTPGWEGNKSEGRAQMKRTGELMNELQERLYAEGRAGGKRSVLVLVQGLDTSGKGGIARHVMGLVDPQGVQMRSFGKPTEEELAQHYLWRIRKALPDPGRIGLFDRSHYEDVLAVRVLNLVPKDEWMPRYEEINEFERELVAGGTIVLKFAMMISHDHQGVRLMRRLDRPDRYWKYSTSDLETRSQWNAYQDAYQAVFERTSTDHAPWYVLPADRRWFPRLAVTEILTRTLIEMDMGWPQPRWKPETQRRLLARTMSTDALRESYEETEDVVVEAIEESIDVRRDAVEVLARQEGFDESKTLALIEEKRQELLATLEATMADKQALLAEREHATVTPDPIESTEAVGTDGSKNKTQRKVTAAKGKKSGKSKKSAKDKKSSTSKKSASAGTSKEKATKSDK